MKKKTIILIVSAVVICSTYLYFKYFYGWMEFRKNTDTPKEYMNHTIIKKDDYVNDSNKIIKGLRTLLMIHKDFFSSKAYFDSTELLIDTILYSPDFNKLAILLITKNPTYRQLRPNKKYEWYYDATCYLGLRQKDTIALNWIGPTFTNSYNKQNISDDIKEASFRTFVTEDTTDAYAYNLNDIRFWNGPIWKKIEDEKREKKE